MGCRGQGSTLLVHLGGGRNPRAVRANPQVTLPRTEVLLLAPDWQHLDDADRPGRGMAQRRYRPSVAAAGETANPLDVRQREGGAQAAGRAWQRVEAQARQRPRSLAVIGPLSPARKPRRRVAPVPP